MLDRDRLRKATLLKAAQTVNLEQRDLDSSPGLDGKLYNVSLPFKSFLTLFK